MEVIFATTNLNKVREIKEMLEGKDISVLSMKDINLDMEIEETGKSFAENAKIKAEAVSKATGKLAIADDSGLVVDAMDGAPGIYSSRFMGEDTDYKIKCRAIMDNLKDTKEEERSARFVCAMAIAEPSKETKIFEGIFEGRIAHEYKGENGFGYDPIFFVPELGKTSAEISPDEKNEISHRGKALRKVVKELEARNENKN